MTDPTMTRPVAFITGGARGIGLAIGRWFLAHGHAVALIDIDAETLARTERALVEEDGAADRILAVHCDVSKPDQVSHAVAPVMLREKRGGAVVNIASISGLRASTLRVAYGTSKGALVHLTKQQAIELGNAGIRVNAIAPGPVDTDLAKLVHTVAIRADYHDVIPLNRYDTVEEVADAVGFLCGAQAAYINGQVLAVDGGFDASGVGLPTLRKN